MKLERRKSFMIACVCCKWICALYRVVIGRILVYDLKTSMNKTVIKVEHDEGWKRQLKFVERLFYVMCFSSCRVPFKECDDDEVVFLSFMITQWKEVCCLWLHDLFMFCYRYPKYVWNVSFELICSFLCSFFSRNIFMFYTSFHQWQCAREKETFYNSHPAPIERFFVENHVPSDITSKIN